MIPIFILMLRMWKLCKKMTCEQNLSFCTEKVIWAITFSEPTAHSSPLFSDFKILKLADIHINFVFPHLFLNVLMILVQLISESFPDLLPQFILIIPEVQLVMTFSLVRETHYNMEYIPSAITV